jgi:hypothetical protein
MEPTGREENMVNGPRMGGPGAMAARVRAVAGAERRGDLEVLAGELDLLFEDAAAWAAQVRERHAALPDDRRNDCKI